MQASDLVAQRDESFREMGAAAANLLLAIVARQAPAQTRFELSTTLVVRGSTAPPPPAADL